MSVVMKYLSRIVIISVLKELNQAEGLKRAARRLHRFGFSSSECQRVLLSLSQSSLKHQLIRNERGGTDMNRTRRS